jgi:hypothetical protein
MGLLSYSPHELEPEKALGPSCELCELFIAVYGVLLPANRAEPQRDDRRVCATVQKLH